MSILRRFRARSRVKRWLAGREPLPADEWVRMFAARGASSVAAAFVLEHFGLYSGLDFRCVRAQDRLREDLGFPDVAFRDWDFDLIEDFEARFGRELSVALKEQPQTIDDWVRELSQHVIE